MGKMERVVILLTMMVCVGMKCVECQYSLEGMLDKVKEAGVTQEQIEEAANSEEAKKALSDGTAQQALNDAEDAASGSGWGSWVKNTVGGMGLKKGAEVPAPSSDETADIEVELSPAESPQESESIEKESSSPSSSPSLSPKAAAPIPEATAPTPDAAAPAPDA